MERLPPLWLVGSRLEGLESMPRLAGLGFRLRLQCQASHLQRTQASMQGIRSQDVTRAKDAAQKRWRPTYRVLNRFSNVCGDITVTHG